MRYRRDQRGLRAPRSIYGAPGLAVGAWAGLALFSALGQYHCLREPIRSTLLLQRIEELHDLFAGLLGPEVWIELAVAVVVLGMRTPDNRIYRIRRAVALTFE